MARRIEEANFQEIIEAVARNGDGLSARQIHGELGDAVAFRTLQYRLNHLVKSGRLKSVGAGRGRRYLAPTDTGEHEDPVTQVPLSQEGTEIRDYVERPQGGRTPVGYDRKFLDAYRPGETWYLSADVRAHLHEVGTPKIARQPSGTYATHILNRLLADLSWNSSRLEGNTYSWLETERLIQFDHAAEGKSASETQMIRNHKDAINFLVGNGHQIGFNRATILNLHALLSNNLLPNPGASGQLRRIEVCIGQSVFIPLAIPQVIEECFDGILAKAHTIQDPFEQAFFVMVHLPYLQPFDDVNKRVSRLGANIPLIKANLSPLSFSDVPKSLYVKAVLGVYELNRIELLRDVFVWAYERSASRYAAVRQTLGEPDLLKLKYQDALVEIVGDVVRSQEGRRAAFGRIAEFAGEEIPVEDREAFRQAAELELLSLHEGNYARYRLQRYEFDVWQQAWYSKLSE